MTGKEMIGKLQFFKEADKKVHLKLFVGRFYNGSIISIDIDNGLIVFEDNKIGEMPISISEIERVEPFTENY